MTAKPSQRGNDIFEVLKFKDFQGPLTSNSKTFKALFHFQGLSRSWKNVEKIKDFQELSRPCGHPGDRVRVRVRVNPSGPPEWRTSGMADPWNGGPLEWRTSGMADRNQQSNSACL